MNYIRAFTPIFRLVLGILFIYFIGRAFYRLAERHNRSRWPFAILGVAAYYGGTLLFGFGLGIFWALTEPDSLDSYNDTAIGLMALPIGLLTCWLVYRFLDNRFVRLAPQNVDELIHDFGEAEIVEDEHDEIEGKENV